MTTATARAAVEEDANAVGWTAEEVRAFRHCLSVLAESEGLESYRFSAAQMALYHPIPRRTREGLLAGHGYAAVNLPRSVARFLGWWRQIETSTSAVAGDEFDWLRATYLFVTDTETRRAWQAMTELAGNLHPLFAHLPRKRAR